ncbi:hypothetical protein [Olleya sp. YS]|uniref:hypothetical protein n=1 Tax=Olleya sp. YS TaxID=3028318 RepID=UPI0024344FE4|nr:hypothetical protein [Olleya sp. YS]WGD35627.1 hypothetical protein Ollyesu_04270 [Olleya sp. YS]
MNPNKLLSIIVILCILPLIVMTANSGVEVVDNLEPLHNNNQAEQSINKTLKVGDAYFDVKVKVPNYKIVKTVNKPIVISTNKLTIELDEVATNNTTKYNISNNSKITKIKPIK